MGQRHVCTFRLAQRAAYRTAISAAQTCQYYIEAMRCFHAHDLLYILAHIRNYANSVGVVNWISINSYVGLIAHHIMYFLSS